MNNEQENNEKVVLEIRRHPYVFVIESIPAILFLVISFFIILSIGAAAAPLSPDEMVLLAFASMLVLFITWEAMFIVWTNYYLDAWFLTEKRIVDMEQQGLFNRDISEFRLERVQDVTVEVRGLLATVLHFGDIHVQTAGESREFIIRHIPEPYKVKDAIMREHERISGMAK